MSFSSLDDVNAELAKLNALLVKVPGNTKLLQQIELCTMIAARFTERQAATNALTTNNTVLADIKARLVSEVGSEISNLVYGTILCGETRCTGNVKCVRCQIEEHQTNGLTAEEIKTLLLL